MELKGIAIRAQRRAPMQLLPTCAVSLEKGLVGDYRGKPGRRQVTLLSESAWAAACAELDQDLPWQSRRANLLVSVAGFSPDDVGRILKIGPVQLQITRETDPCDRMDEIFPGLRQSLTPDWRGGACCRVIRAGEITVGDPVEWL